MSTNVDSMVQGAIQAYRAGNKTQAREMLEKATELDSYNEDAWMWLSAVVETPEDQRVCLENVLVINPNNENAKKGLQMLSTSSAAPKAPETPSTAAPPTATSSASAAYNPDNEISHEEYDDWVSGLNLGQDEEEAEAAAPDNDVSNQQFANIFADAFQDDFEDEESEEVNLFAEETEAPAGFDQEPFAKDNVFADDDSFGLDELRQATTFEEPTDDDDDLFLSDEELLFGEDADSMTEGPFTSESLDFAAEPIKPPTASRRSRPRSPSSPTESANTGALLADDAFDTVTNLDPSQYFQAIPKQNQVNTPAWNK